MPKKVQPRYNSLPLNPTVTKKKVTARAVETNTRLSLFSLIKFLVLLFMNIHYMHRIYKQHIPPDEVRYHRIEDINSHSEILLLDL